MITVSVRREANFAVASFQSVHDNKIKTATVRALNRALDTSQTIANRKIRETYNVKARAVAKAMKKHRAHRGQAYAYAELKISGERIPLIEFGARWTRRMKPGASVQIFKAGARKRIRGAFIGVHGYTGARQVFVRKDLSDPRSDIKSLRGVSIPQQFRNKAVLAVVKQATREAFSKNFQQQLKFLSGT